MSLENPFFLRELRAAGRRGFSAVTGPALIQTVLATLAFLILEDRLPWALEEVAFRRVLAALVLGFGQAGACGYAGWQLGARVFMEEHRQSTLESLRLVSMSPWRWLPQKLLYPVYGLALVWLSVLPFHAALVIRGHFLPRDLLPGLLLAGCAGLVSFGTALMAPPEGLRGLLRMEVKTSLSEIVNRAGHVGLAYWLFLIIVMLEIHWLTAIASPRVEAFREQRFYGTWLRTDYGLALLLVAFLLAALGSGLATANPTSRFAGALGRTGRPLAFLAAYYVFVGYTWSGLSPTYRYVALLIPPVAALVYRLFHLRKRTRRPEDPWAAREVDWLQSISGNPVFVRDLRVLLRPAGFRRLLLTQVLALVGGSILLSGFSLMPFFPLPLWPPAGTPGDFLRRMFSVIFFFGICSVIPLLLTFGARAAQMWQGETRANTMTQLITSPLETETLIRGRWVAGSLVGLVRSVPILLGLVVSILALFGSRGMDYWLAFGIWIASQGLVLSAGYAGTTRRLTRFTDVFAPIALSVYVLVVEGIGLGYVLAHPELFGTGSGAEGLLVYVLLASLLNVLLTYAIYSKAVADLERQRQRDLE